MFVVKKFYRSLVPENVKIFKEGDKFRLINKVTEENLLQDEYDNIFTYGEGIFVLCRKGKFGAVRVDDSLNVEWIAECKYDTLDEEYHDLIFSEEDDYVYYNAYSRDYIRLKDARIYDGFIYGEDEETYMIVDTATGKVIWSDNKNDERLISWPCFKYCGRVDGNPVFYDITHANHIIKMKNGYARYDGPYMVKPIIINGVNVINICEEKGESGIKLGTLDVKNKKIIKPRYDEIDIELKVKYKSGNDYKEAIFNIDNIKAGEVVPIEEWLGK